MARPRSAQAHKKVLNAAMELFSERGIDSTSMDAIAEASGVSKATIYKHWPDKDALCLEVMGYLHGLDEEPPVFDSGDYRADLIAQLQYHPAADRKALREKMTPQMIAYASRNQVLGAAWRARVVEPARMALTNLLKRGEKRGVLRHGIDPEVGIALLLGPMIYRHVFARKLGQKVPENLEVAVADAFLAAFGTGKQKTTRQTTTRR
ncbi:MAG TPA: TetR/AcrR family transcriptional regulator [Acidobacteriaceae bacterium]|jgi:AcrR family transcriptional regulator|nr:TetR/AcrR family transcriptional regulator [Acidobacteriaceae bacterium]